MFNDKNKNQKKEKNFEHIEMLMNRDEIILVSLISSMPYILNLYLLNKQMSGCVKI